MNKQEVAEANYTVYQHTVPNGKNYIGITRQEIGKRWKNGKGYCRTSIKDVLKGKYKRHRGYTWRYFEEAV